MVKFRIAREPKSGYWPSLRPLTWLIISIWAVVLYVSWMDYDDCIGALRRIGETERRLAELTAQECRAAYDRLFWVGMGGLGAVVLLELIARRAKLLK